MSAPRVSMASRAATTPTEPEKASPQSGFWDDGAVLAMPRQETRTARQIADAEAKAATEDQNARRCAARHHMKNGHGCTGGDCTHPRHAADAVLMHQAIQALGRELDPGASWEPNPGYHQAVRKRSEPGGAG